LARSNEVRKRVVIKKIKRGNYAIDFKTSNQSPRDGFTRLSKLGANGKPGKLKARLVAKGSSHYEQGFFFHCRTVVLAACHCIKFGGTAWHLLISVRTGKISPKKHTLITRERGVLSIVLVV